MEKAEGSGSLWNVNSWHWENKNYTEVAKSLLTSKILSLTFETSQKIKINMQKIVNFKGEAQINIRKGKQIVCYEFNIEVEFKAVKDSIEVEGSYKICDVNESDLDFEVQSLVMNSKSDINDDVKSFLKKNLKPSLENLFKNLNKELIEIEADPKKLQEDKLKREQALQETQKAKLEKGAEKEKLLEEQKLKERQLKEENMKKI